MSLPRFTVRVRTPGRADVRYPVQARTGESVLAAVRRALRAATADAAADLGCDAQLGQIQEGWRRAYVLSWIDAEGFVTQAEVHVPPVLCTAWL